jgi:hypothetical protein
MKKERKNTKTVLIDIEYKRTLNHFEEFYGENISYQEMEQESYIEFKNMMFEYINQEIKFRKYGRLSKCLTIKAEMLESEIKLFDDFLKSDFFKFTTDWKISNITLIKD